MVTPRLTLRKGETVLTTVNYSITSPELGVLNDLADLIVDPLSLVAAEVKGRAENVIKTLISRGEEEFAFYRNNFPALEEGYQIIYGNLHGGQPSDFDVAGCRRLASSPVVAFLEKVFEIVDIPTLIEKIENALEGTLYSFKGKGWEAPCHEKLREISRRDLRFLNDKILSKIPGSVKIASEIEAEIGKSSVLDGGPVPSLLARRILGQEGIEFEFWAETVDGDKKAGKEIYQIVAEGQSLVRNWWVTDRNGISVGRQPMPFKKPARGEQPNKIAMEHDQAIVVYNRYPKQDCKILALMGARAAATYASTFLLTDPDRRKEFERKLAEAQLSKGQHFQAVVDFDFKRYDDKGKLLKWGVVPSPGHVRNVSYIIEKLS